MDEGVWVRPFGDIVYLMPPFIVTNEQRAALGDAVVTVMTEWSMKSG
jgi:adenosylmethionine-8-amino-7-oxononanoate aminotransferase